MNTGFLQTGGESNGLAESSLGGIDRNDKKAMISHMHGRDPQKTFQDLVGLSAFIGAHRFRKEKRKKSSGWHGGDNCSPSDEIHNRLLHYSLGKPVIEKKSS